MSKRKHRDLSPELGARSVSPRVYPNANMNPNSEPEQEQVKKTRNALNFSIESIMQPAQMSPRRASPASSFSGSSRTSQRDSRSRSRSRSPATSISGAGSEASPGSSRSSTPIWPGAHPSQLASGNPLARNQRLTNASISANSKSNSSPISNSNSNNNSNSKKHPHASALDSWSKERLANHQHQQANQQHLSKSKQANSSDPRLAAPFDCHLDNLDLWHRFHAAGQANQAPHKEKRGAPQFQQQQQQLHQPASDPASQLAADGSNLEQWQQAARVKGSYDMMGNGRLDHVECMLDNKDMWDKFHSLNTEMIITKTGRRMFPVMKVQFHNLDPNTRYAVSMSILPVDKKRYRYAYHKSCWQVAGKADPLPESHLYPHPDSPFNGDLLSRQVVSFEKVKLTNNETDKSGHIILNSMHKYQPFIHLIELKVPSATTPGANYQTTSKSSTSLSDHHNNNNNHHHHNHHHHHQQQPQLEIEAHRVWAFQETVFTAVTAYQNQLITKLKIDKNPFAKGFRDSSRLSDSNDMGFDYMGSLGPSNRFVGQSGAPGSLEAVAASGAHMDAYQLLASAANNPWYSAAAVAAAAGGGNPFNPMNAAACSTAQAAQLQATQMWLAAFSACLNGNSSQAGGLAPPLGPLGPAGMLPLPVPSPHGLAKAGGIVDQALGEHGPDSSSSSANSSGTSN